MKLKPLAALVALAWAECALAAPIRMPVLESLFAPFFRGPSTIKTNSEKTQFAGRTTLGSGQASVTVSTAVVQSGSLIFPHVNVALPAAYSTNGQLSLVSGSNTGVVSTSAIYSGMNVMLTLEGLTSQLSGYPRGVRVNSIVNGVSFGVATVDSMQLQGTNAVHWRIPEAIPEGLKVNTISDGSYFTIGWADGEPRPVDTVVMWEVKNPTS